MLTHVDEHSTWVVKGVYMESDHSPHVDQDHTLEHHVDVNKYNLVPMLIE